MDGVSPAFPGYHIATYGCQMNEYDSNMLAEMLESHDSQECKQPEDADLILVNTCSVREKAEENAYARITQFAHLKKKNPSLRIAVLGCMARNHQEKILERLPFVDYIAGPDNYKELENLLFHPAADEQDRKVITEFDEVENYFGARARLQNSWSSFITIQRGCNKKCAYCIVPFVRGKEKYRPVPDILDEVRFAADRGAKEITLLGQTVNSYRFEDCSFAELLTMTADVPGVERVRFTSPHPRHFDEALIEVMTSHPKVCSHAHLPLQSGSDRILKKMRRQYTADGFMEIVEALRARDPEFAITTDIITGFVGETEEDFQQTLDLVRRVRFDNAFMFSYSPREGTEAYPEVESLSEEEKKARLQTLIDVQNEITTERAHETLNTRQTVMVEGPSSRNENELMGKTDTFKKVILPAEIQASPGDLVDVEIAEIRGRTLIARKIA